MFESVYTTKNLLRINQCKLLYQHIWKAAESEPECIFEPLHEKTVFGVFDQVRLKPACSAKETSREIVSIETRDIILSQQRTKKVLIKLICAFVVRISQKRVFS